MTSRGSVIRTALRRGGVVPDPQFDRLLPADVRRLSSVHWTPVAVAVRAAALLAPEPGMRVLDVGSGPGKMCCIGSLVTNARWTGIEREAHLVEAANALALELEVGGQARFQRGDILEPRWKDFDSLYFFNPFEMALFGGEPAETGHRWALFANEVERVAAALADLPSGTRVVTYHGYGGEIPAGFVLEGSERVGDGVLAAWTRTTRRHGSVRSRSGWRW